jgi:DNA-binding MarR family transcriptional regulator
VSHCISSLEAKGLVQRRIDPEDARAVQLMLRPQGRRRAVRVVGILDRMQRQFEEGVGTARLEEMMGQMFEVEDLCSRVARSAK